MSWIQSDFQKDNTDTTYVPPSWSTGTDAEIVEALEKHYTKKIDLTEYWSVGDTRQVTLSAMSATGVGESHAQQTVTFVLSNVGGIKLYSYPTVDCVFQVDQVQCLNETGYMHNKADVRWSGSARRTWCNNIYYNAIPSTLRGIFKQFSTPNAYGSTADMFALRSEYEVFGSTSVSGLDEGSPVTWYTTTSNRIKKVNGSNAVWWERSPRNSSTKFFCAVTNSGTSTYYSSTANYGIAPFGVI